MPELPTGTVTFLFTDVEGSIRLWEEHPIEAGVMLSRHDEIFEEVVERYAGVVVRPRGEGDSRFAVFARATDAVVAAVNVQLAFTKEPWPRPLKVRAALHTGETDLRAGDYYGSAVNRCARLRAIAHGGQTLVSGASEELVRGSLQEGARLTDVGSHRLRDLAEPMHVFQLCHADLPSDFPPLASMDVAHHNLPVQLTSFVGREAELADVRGFLADGRLVTLTGAPGCGKTRLALHVAAELLDEHREGVWFVDLAAIRDPEMVPNAVAATLPLQPHPDRPVVETLSTYARSRQMLLLFDNCEHLLDACARLARTLIGAGPGIRILATSRESLGVAGEIAWRVPSLSIPDPVHATGLEALSAFDAARLFLRRAQAAAPSLVLADRDAAAVAQICHRLDGIPLAIELAASRADVLDLTQIAERLDDRFRLLSGGDRLAVERQQTLRAAVDWSYELLAPSEQTLFDRTSVFVGGFTLESCEGVCTSGEIGREHVLDLLTQLVRKSLVVAERPDGRWRYRLLETMRQYASERLLQRGDREATLARHRDWFLGFAEEASERSTGPEIVRWLDALETEWGNCRAALGFSARAEPEIALRITCALARFWEKRAHHEEARRWFAELLPAAPPHSMLRARALWASIGSTAASPEVSHARLDEAVAIVRDIGDEATLSKVLGMLAAALSGMGRIDEGRSRIDESLAIARRLGLQRETASALHLLAVMAKGYEPSKNLYDEALREARGAGAKDLLAGILLNSAASHAMHRNFEAARGAGREGLAIARELKDPSAITKALGRMDHVESLGGELALARTLREEYLALVQRIGVREWEPRQALGRLARRTGDLAAARAHHEEALRLGREQRAEPQAIAALLSDLGAVAILEEHFEQGRSCCEEALALSRPFIDVDPANVVSFLDLLGLAEWELGNVERAAVIHREALEISRDHDLPATFGTLEGLAAVAAARGRPLRAARLFAATRAALGEERARSALLDLYERRLEMARTLASAQEFERAWAEGSAMSADEAVAYAFEETDDG